MLCRVLVVDHDIEIRNIIAEIFDFHGFLAVGAAGGRKAAMIVSSEDFDVLVIEVTPLQDVHGIMLARLARKRRINVPVIFISSYISELAKAADFRPPHACLAKPFGMSQILATTRRFNAFII